MAIDLDLGGAGLGDRLGVIRKSLALAEDVCSILYVPPPCVMLARHHNSNSRVACSRRWSDYVDTSDYVRRLVVKVGSKLPSDAPPIFTRLNNQRQHRLRGDHKWPCFSLVPPIPLLPWANRIENIANLTAQALPFQRFRGLHIRRGDLLKRCDSSVARVRAAVFLKARSTLPTVYWTNEKSGAYHKELARSLMRDENVTSQVVWLDPMVSKIMKTTEKVSDNFSLYAVLEAFKARAEEFLDYHPFHFDCASAELDAIILNQNHLVHQSSSAN